MHLALASSHIAMAQALTQRTKDGSYIVDRKNYPGYEDNLDSKIVHIGDVPVGDRFVLIAGPCTVQHLEQTMEVAQTVKELGAHILRGGAYKPRTNPYSFQGLGEEGLRILQTVKERVSMPLVTEVMDPRDVDKVGAVVDCFQIGARNMQNYPLLKEVGEYCKAHKEKAVMLKTGLAATLPDVMGALEWLAFSGAENILVCERGSSLAGNNGLRYHPNFDLLKELRIRTPYPIIGDPSHSAGKSELVPKIADAYLGAKVDGLMIEVMRDSEQPIDEFGNEVCDYKQGLRVKDFAEYIKKLSLTRK